MKVLQVLLDLIADCEGRDVLREHLANRFNVYFDFEQSSVRIEDDLAMGDESEVRIDLDRFKTLLETHRSASDDS